MLDNSVINKIAGLLRLAHDNANAAEAANAAGRAQALLEKYRLTMADVTQGADTEAVGEASEPLFGKGAARACSWRGVVAGAVCRANMSYGFFRRGSFVVVGKASNVQIAEYFYRYLETEIERLCKAAVLRGACDVIDGTWDPGIGSDKASTMSFRLGAAHAVAARLREGTTAARADATRAGQGAAIVKVEGESRALAKWVKEKYDLRSRGISSVGNRSAYGQGTKAGQGIALARGLGGRPVRLLGSG